jgi:hypothetical protein
MKTPSADRAGGFSDRRRFPLPRSTPRLPILGIMARPFS